MRIVAYERVSTGRQGASGLGLAAQRQAIDGYASARHAAILGRFTEVESGRNPDRPELTRALHLARVTGATLVIAKLDRLSRNTALAGAPAGRGAIGIVQPHAAAPCDRERLFRAPGDRLALLLRHQRHDAHGQVIGLGQVHGHEPHAAVPEREQEGGVALRATVARNADAHAQDLARVVAEIRAAGHTSLRASAVELDARGMRTRRGGRWHVSTVINLLDRLGLMA